MDKLRGRGKNKCYWEETETQLLIEVLQDMSCDPLWKNDGGFRSNYMGELHRRIPIRSPNFSKQVSPHIESKVKWLKTKFHIINDLLKLSGFEWNDVDKIACKKEAYDNYCNNHKEAKGLWDVQFPYFNQLKLVYGRDRATGAAVEGYGDAIHNMETDQNVETGGDHLGDFHFSLSDDEENELPYVPQATTKVTNATREPRKQKIMYKGNKAANKKKKPNMEARLEGIDDTFRMFVQGFNTNFGTMENAVANSMNDDNMHQKAASKKMKDVLVELMKLNLPSGDVLQAADIFSANKDKIDIFLNLSKQL
ncbi:Myb/SANT-like domain-containing protein [Tanacetum coccineum]